VALALTVGGIDVGRRRIGRAVRFVTSSFLLPSTRRPIGFPATTLPDAGPNVSGKLDQILFLAIAFE
jgi:hypothetical protein